MIEQVLDAVGIARIGVPGYEADDVMGTLAVRAGGQVDIVTGDRDLFQLVDDAQPGPRPLHRAGVKNLQFVDEAAVAAKYGIPGRSYADFATLRGDPSDGLPGVPGVGDKTAAALITRFGSLEALLEPLDEGRADPGAAGQAAAARDYLRVAPAVVQVARDVPIPAIDLTLPASRATRRPWPRWPSATASAAPWAACPAVLEAAS